MHEATPFWLLFLGNVKFTRSILGVTKTLFYWIKHGFCYNYSFVENNLFHYFIR